MSGVEIETVSLSEGTGDRALWRAVIVQAINDATLFCNPDAASSEARARASAKREAIEWLKTPNANFNRVCALADLEPTHVRKLANAQLSKAEHNASAREARFRNASARATKAAAKRAMGDPRAVRQSKPYTFYGQTLTLEQWASKTGLKLATIRTRLSVGWSIERAITEPSSWIMKRKQRPGVVANFAETPRDRSGPVAQDCA